jgi:uncharacterized protein YkwD
MRHVVVFCCLWASALAQPAPKLGEAVSHSENAALPAKSPSQRFASAPAAIPATWFDTASRLTSQLAWLNDFLPTTGVSPGFTGSVPAGNAGSTSVAWKEAALKRINYFRAMAGVPANITFDATLNSKSQSGALMLAANNALSHNPPPSWQYYTADAADAVGHGNICYYSVSSVVSGYLSDPGCVAQYVADQGAGNEIVGHRRWILYSRATKMGTGDVTTPYNNAFSLIWNTLYVIHQPSFLSSPAPTRDGFIAWPPKGYVPYQIVPPRWSFAVPGNSDLSAAIVKVTKNGIPITQTLAQYASNYGDNTVIFNPDNRGTDNADPIAGPAPSSDTTYTVTVEGVKLNGITQPAYTYDVVVFNPTVTPGNNCFLNASTVNAASGHQNIAVTVSGAGCGAWSAASSASWAAVFPLSGTGPGTVNITVYPNFSTSTRATTLLIAGNPFTITQPPLGGTADERFVQQSYFYLLGRMPTTPEVAFQVQNGLTNGRGVLVNNFLNSGEFNQTGRYVAGLYVGLLNRDAEFGGWQFQRNALLDNQVDRIALVRNFITSQEFQLKYPNQSDEQYVRMLYRQVLLREPSQEEVDFQVAHLNGDRVGLASRFLISPEFALGTGPRLLAFLYYATMLNRDPSPAELQTTVTALTSASDDLRLTLINNILSSEEYQALLQ